jgi:Putative peptidoglycan binding domain
MKKFTSLLIGFSLALAGAAMAQQPEQQATPKGKKQGAEETHRAEGKPGARPAKPEATAAKQRGGRTEQAQNAEVTPKPERRGGRETKIAGERGATATPGVKQPAGERREGAKERAAAAKTSATPAAASAAPSVGTANERRGRGNAAVAGKNKPAPEQVQQIKAQHANFHAQPKPDRAPAVTFNQNYRIQGSERWQGAQYEVFRSYHPEWHDQGWYRSRFGRVELIGGGYYYWNNGYWYPAWGYDPGAQYYAYDGPVYVGHRAEPPDQVIADVQSELQQMGYYQGEVDGLLGPMTREALSAYQADNGLVTTEAIDEPTLDSLGLAS